MGQEAWLELVKATVVDCLYLDYHKHLSSTCSLILVQNCCVVVMAPHTDGRLHKALSHGDPLGSMAESTSGLRSLGVNPRQNVWNKIYSPKKINLSCALRSGKENWTLLDAEKSRMFYLKICHFGYYY